MALGENRKNVPEQAIAEKRNWLKCSGTKETECKIRQITMKASGIFQWMKYSLKYVSEGCIWKPVYSGTSGENNGITNNCSGTCPVPARNLGLSLWNMVPEHPSDLDPCSHLLASVFIADLEKAAPGKMRPNFSGQFLWRRTYSNRAQTTFGFRHW